MHGTTKQIAVLLLVIGLGFVLGRLAVRGFMNVLIAERCLEETFCE